MPAAAVIPAPIAYIKIVAVKKLVVELCSAGCTYSFAVHATDWTLRGTLVFDIGAPPL